MTSIRRPRATFTNTDKCGGVFCFRYTATKQATANCVGPRRFVVFAVGRDAVARRQFRILCVYGWSMLIDVDYANRCCVGSLVAHPVWANCRSSSCAPSTLTGFQLRSTCCVKRDCCKCSIFSRMCACVPVRSWHARCTTDTEYRTGHLYNIL